MGQLLKAVCAGGAYSATFTGCLTGANSTMYIAPDYSRVQKLALCSSAGLF